MTRDFLILFHFFQLFPTVQFDYDYIELLNGRFFKFSSRCLVRCPFKEKDFGLLSPRTFQPFDTKNTSFKDAGYFSESLLNCFPDLVERVRFCNKFYQCFLCWQLPHKAKKLVVVGEKNSGKTTWSKVFFGLIPKQKIAVLSKEDHFGASMINDDTELLWIDEWKKEMLSDDTLKTMMQGGYFTQSVKHQNPKMQNMQAGVYMTCNKIPNYGEEQDNVEQRLYICETKQLERKCPGAPLWIETNAMRCLLWLAVFINKNIPHVEKEERFYERPKDVSAHATIDQNIPKDILKEMKNATLFDPNITITTTDDIQNDKGKLLIIHMVSFCISLKICFNWYTNIVVLARYFIALKLCLI